MNHQGKTQRGEKKKNEFIESGQKKLGLKDEDQISEVNLRDIQDIRSILNLTKSAVFRLELKEKILHFLNVGVTQYLEIEPESLKNIKFDDLLKIVHPHDRNIWNNFIIKVNEGEVRGDSISEKVELRLNTNTNLFRWFRISFVLEKKATNSKLILFEDINEEKSAVDRLMQNQERLQAILNSSENISVLVINPVFEIEYSWFSKKIQKKYGLTLPGKIDFDYIKSVSLDLSIKLKQAVEQTFETKQNFMLEDKIKFPNGYFYFKINLIPIYDKNGETASVTCFLQDVTEAEKVNQVKDFRVRLENLLSNMSTYFINLPVSKINTGVDETLKAVCEFLGFSHSSIFEFRANEEAFYMTHEWRNEDFPVLEERRKVFNKNDFGWLTSKIKNFEHLYIQDVKKIPAKGVELKKMLESLNVKSALYIPMIYDGNLIGLIAFKSLKDYKNWGPEIISLIKLAAEILVNVIKRYEAESKLIESEERFRTIFESTDDCIVVWDTDNNIIYANKSYISLVQKPRGEIIGQPASNSMKSEPYVYEEWLERVQNVIKAGKTMHIRDHGFSFRGEYWADSTISPLRDASGDIFGAAILYRNITDKEQIKNELNNYREKMIRAEQLASLGILSATVAHEINQPLTVIKLLLQQTKRAVKKSSDKDNLPIENVIESLKELDNASRIVNRFRVFARKMPRDTIQEVDMERTVEKIIASLQTSAKKAGLKITTLGFEKIPMVEANIGELEQIFFIMIQNAIQAVRPSKKSTLKILAEHNKENIKITFKDTCSGISQENLKKIFEPFFTTKPAKEGTGLGLSIVKQLLDSRGGEIKVSSEPGIGTCFDITFPVKQC